MNTRPFRAIRHNLCMGESVPFGQPFHYHSDHPMEAVLDDRYFMPVRDNFRVGDRISICRIVANRVRAVAEVRVVQVTKETVEIFQVGDTVLIPDRRAEEPTPATSLPPEIGLSVKEGFECFQVVNDKGKVIDEFPSQELADAFIAEKLVA